MFGDDMLRLKDINEDVVTAPSFIQAGFCWH
ncbi:hypothetical protein ADUPG1_014105, partial [Aduncisulcus paluster]